MALTNCPECNARVSDKAEECPQCGSSKHRVARSSSACPECGQAVARAHTGACPGCGNPNWSPASIAQSDLSSVSKVHAMTLDDAGGRVLTIEYSLTSERIMEGFSVNVYDLTERGRRLQHTPLHNNLFPLPVIAVAKDPEDLLLLTREGGKPQLQMYSLAAQRFIGNSVEQPRFATGFSAFLYSLFGQNNFHPTPVALRAFDGGRYAVLHDGQSSEMGHRLVSFDLSSGRLRCDPVNTWINHRTAEAPSGAEGFSGGVENHAEAVIAEQGIFFTGSRFGWVRKWRASDLSLLDHWQIELPDYMGSVQWPNCTVRALATSVSGSKIAAGTEAGSIHVLESYGANRSKAPLVPEGFYGSGLAKSSCVSGLSFCCDDRFIVASYGNGAIRIWDVETGAQVGDTIQDGPMFQGKESFSVTSDLVVIWFTSYRRKFETWDLHAHLISASALQP